MLAVFSTIALNSMCLKRKHVRYHACNITKIIPIFGSERRICDEFVSWICFLRSRPVKSIQSFSLSDSKKTSMEYYWVNIVVLIGQQSLTELSFWRLWRSIWHTLKTVSILKIASEGQFILASSSVFEIFSCARIPTSQSKKAGPKIKRSPYLKFQGRSQGQLKNKNFDISSKPIVIIMTKPFLLCWNPLFILLVISFWMLNYWRLFLGTSLRSNLVHI